MNRLIFLLALAFTPVSWGADNVDEIAAQLSRRLSQRAVVRADFVQEKQMVAFKKPLVTRGKMIFVRNQGVLWKIESPLRLTYVLTEDRIVEISEDGQAQVRTARDVAGLAQVGRIFRALLGAQTGPLAELFTFAGDTSPERWRLSLQPKPGPVAQYMKLIRLDGARHVEHIRIDEVNGDSTAIVFSNASEDDGLSPDERAILRRP
jgi:hypothetical protein